MLDQEYQTMRSVEDGYWWYKVLREMTANEVVRATVSNPIAHLLDAGCGTGGTLAVLRERKDSWKLNGFDVSPLALEHTRERGFHDVFQASVDEIPLPDASLDVIVSLDVLCSEGVNQERSMKEFCRVLRRDGKLIMNLPAYRCLRGQHDVAVYSARRYTPQGVKNLHQRHEFVVNHVFCWNAWLFLPILFWRQISKRHKLTSLIEAKSDLVPPPVWVNAFLTRVGTWEFRVCKAIKCPIGTSVFSIAQRRATS